MFFTLSDTLMFVSGIMRILRPSTSETQRISAGLMGLSETIGEIMQISGVPGVSIGVLHHGSIIYEKGFGYRNLEEGHAPDEHTSFIIGSMTKAFTAALTATIVEAGKINWNSKIQDVISSFRPERDDASCELTVTDLLSHRTGLTPNDNLWLGSNNQNLLGYNESLLVLAHARRVAPIRSQFIYNNFAYDVMSHVIEKVSGKSFDENLREHILVPLSLRQTFYGTGPPNSSNVALPYGVLADGERVRLPIPLSGNGTLMRAAGGIRSTVHDLLLLYQAFNKAAEKQIVQQENADPEDPLKQMRHLWQANMPMNVPSLREFSYASGWVRVQLPARMDLSQQFQRSSPIVGETRPSRLAMYHQGSIPGYQSYVTLFPETSSAIVVLSNGLSLTDHCRWLGELLIETLFENKIDPQRYVRIAEKDAKRSIAYQTGLNNELQSESRGRSPCRPIQEYEGRYWNTIRNFFIDVVKEGEKLFVSFQGRDADRFELFPYQDDCFYWKLTYDEMIRLAREPGNPKQFYILSFGSGNIKAEIGLTGDSPNIIQLEWKHDPLMQDQGEIFIRA